MRFALMLALSLAACGADPSPSPGVDASPDLPQDGAPGILDVSVDASPDLPQADAARDVAQLDAGADVAVTVDAAPEASAPPDAVRDVSADVDAADPCGSPALRTCDVNGVPMCVNIRLGRVQSDGTTIHCGRCGNTCTAGMICANECVNP